MEKLVHVRLGNPRSNPRHKFKAEDFAAALAQVHKHGDDMYLRTRLDDLGDQFHRPTGWVYAGDRASLNSERDLSTWVYKGISKDDEDENEKMAAEESDDAMMRPPDAGRSYKFRIVKLNRVIDGDTIVVTIDFGFAGLRKVEKVRLAGIDTPEKRTADDYEKYFGIMATEWMTSQLKTVLNGKEALTIRAPRKNMCGKFGRMLGWLFVGDDSISLNEKMIEEGFAWAYDGGKKTKDFDELLSKRREKETLTKEQE